MVKSRQAPHASTRLRRTGINTIRVMISHVTSKALNVAMYRALRIPVLIGLFVLIMLLLVVVSLDRLELWMAGAGLIMVAMSVASAVQELKFPKIVPLYQDFLDQEMEKCGCDIVTLPRVSLVQQSTTAKKQQKMTKNAMSSMTLNIASAASLSTTSHFPLTFSKKTNQRESEYSIRALESAVQSTAVESSVYCKNNNNNKNAEVNNKLDVLHCGTVIDIQGSLGFIIPHDLRAEANSSCKAIRSRADARFTVRPEKQQYKMPLVIPFKLKEDQTLTRQEIAVGNTVEFALSHTAASSDSSAQICALNVTLVSVDDVIVKSRTALQSCKQAREVSFARAMEELTMISLRNVPVKHHVDLIKYAEDLDNHDASFE